MSVPTFCSPTQSSVQWRPPSTPSAFFPSRRNLSNSFLSYLPPVQPRGDFLIHLSPVWDRASTNQEFSGPFRSLFVFPRTYFSTVPPLWKCQTLHKLNATPLFLLPSLNFIKNPRTFLSFPFARYISEPVFLRISPTESSPPYRNALHRCTRPSRLLINPGEY